MSRAADLLIVGLPATTLGPGDRRALARLRHGGVILFGRNLESPEQLGALVAQVRKASPEVSLYLDAEGGRVDRLRQIVGPAPGGSALAAAPPALARRSGLWIGRALRALGFDVDFAPVVDLDRGAVANALDGRYLGSTPRAVTARAAAFLRGLHAAGVGGCLKHFPGLGAARADTHLEGAPIALAERALRRDLAPFARLAGEAGAVMVSHASYTAFDPSGRPASLSPAIAERLLRRELRFHGVAFSDDLEMKALARWGDLPEIAESALVAGCDLLAVCGAASLEAAPAIARRLATTRLAARREAALRRLARYHRGLAATRRRAGAVSLARVRAALANLQRSFV